MHATTERLYAARNELLEVSGQSAIGMEYFDAGHRKRRLADLAAAKGGPQKLGKLLGYADGSYVCLRRLNFDHLCRLNLDQGLLLV